MPATKRKPLHERPHAMLALGLLVVLAACAPATRSSSLPSGEASFAGRVAAREAGSILLVAASVQPAGSDKASVRWHAGTRLLHASGATATEADLQVGRNVRAWFDGPVAESYPVQATAGTLVIEAP